MATAGYCSAGCGADLLFAEAMLARGAELTVVLPFDREAFYRTSVDFGAPERRAWRDRCEAVLNRATTVRQVRPGGFHGEGDFAAANSLIESLARERARMLGLEPAALVLLDPASVEHPGGTRHFARCWRESGALRVAGKNLGLERNPAVAQDRDLE